MVLSIRVFCITKYTIAGDIAYAYKIPNTIYFDILACMKPQRLGGRKTAEFILRRGKRWSGPLFKVHWVTGTPKKGNEAMPAGVYVGTFASSKLHKSAVVRNRMRRRVREALREELRDAQTFPSVQLLISPRSASLNAPSADIRSEISRFLSTLTHGR